MASRILLDTHVWLWMNGSPSLLSQRAEEILADEENQLCLSAVSAWEIAIKFALGKLELPLPPERYVSSRMTANGVRPIPIQHDHAIQAGALPPHHRDPFDRMLVAQAQQLEMQLMTDDQKIGLYDVSILSP